MLLLLVLAGLLSSPDQPLDPPAPKTFCSANKKYCLEAVPGKDSVLYEHTKGKKKVLWTVPGWQRSAFVRNDGAFVATQYPGLNLLPLDHQGGIVLIELWKSDNNGNSCWSFTVGDAQKMGAGFRRTVSHYEWGQVEGFLPDGKLSIALVGFKRPPVDPAEACRKR